MMKRHLLLSVAGLAFAAIATSAPARAQLLNPTFDNAGTLSDWSGSPGSVSETNFDPQSPAKSAIFFNSFGTLAQSFSGYAAGQYIISFFVKALATSTVGSAFATLTYSVNGENFGAAGGTGWTLNSAVIDLTGGQNTLTFSNAFALNNGFVQLDTISLQAVPGPLAGSGLLSFGAVAVGFAGFSMMRRRKTPAAKA
jgi:hypothetical protein